MLSLQERFVCWLAWDMAMYQIGACLGFWPEFGAVYDNDPWNGTKDVMHTHKHDLGAILEWFLKDLVEEGCLECKAVDIEYILEDGRHTIVPIAHYKWNPKYVGPADIVTTLS
jgi:hypothetical protein